MKSAKKTCLPVFDKNGHFLLATCNRSMVEGGPRKYSLLVPIILSGAITVMMATLFFLGPMVFGIIHDWWVLRDSPGEVQATVTEWVRDKHPPDKRYRYLVKYRFEKDGASFQGESNVSRRERYKAGDQLKVLYSKDDPAINAKAGTLRPWFGFIMAAVMLFFCAVVVGFLLIVRETLKARKIILSGQFIPAKVDKAELFEGHKKQQAQFVHASKAYFS